MIRADLLNGLAVFAYHAQAANQQAHLPPRVLREQAQQLLTLCEAEIRAKEEELQRMGKMRDLLKALVL